MSWMLPISDVLEVLSGKWTVRVLATLRNGSRRFGEIAKETPGITDKMLSKELKSLEANQLVKRITFEEFPQRVEYELTDHGQSFRDLILQIGKWGLVHRRRIIGTAGPQIRKTTEAPISLTTNDIANLIDNDGTP